VRRLEACICRLRPATKDGKGSTWRLAITLGAAITIAATSFNFIGDDLRDALCARSDDI
jgi:ABC-type dipeptide/oligopeptide/nickel transport system permease subunit